MIFDFLEKFPILFSAITLLIAIFGFGFLIFIHELGHLLAAKATGITVNEFAIGFGPTLFHFNIKNTKYSLKPVPFGGFCAMEGEDSESDNDGAFNKKPIWKRAIVLVAGAAFNIIFGLIVMGVILSQAQAFNTTTISKVDNLSRAQQIGIQPNDQILSMNGRHIFSINDIFYSKEILIGEPIYFTVERDGEKVKLPEPMILPPDDPMTLEPEDSIGITFAPVENSFTETIKQTFLQTASICNIVYMSLFDLVSGNIPVSDIAGPIGITSMASETIETGGLSSFVGFLIFITINLGVMNLLPIPALDGGRLAFLGIEAVRRKPVPQKYEAMINGIGFLVLIGFIIIITFKDIYQIIF